MKKVADDDYGVVPFLCFVMKSEPIISNSRIIDEMY